MATQKDEKEGTNGSNRRRSRAQTERTITTQNHTIYDHNKTCDEPQKRKKRDAESREQRAQRSTRTMEGDATTETDIDNDTEEAPKTQNTKRQKTDRTGIG